MLALAAANRWRLTPALAAAAGDDAESVDSDPDAALAAMRRSLIIEASAALAILVLVPWFGTLEPFVAADPVRTPAPPPGRVRSCWGPAGDWSLLASATAVIIALWRIRTDLPSNATSSLARKK